MKLRYLVVAEKIILDHSSLSPTAVDIVDDLEAHVEVEGASLQGLEGLPFQYWLLVTWEREANEANGPHSFLVEFRGPDGREGERREAPTVNFQDKRRFYSRVMFDGIPYHGNGEYSVLIWRENHEVPVGEWKIKINLVDKKPEHGVTRTRLVQRGQIASRPPSSGPV
jgi:hypothetical protein